MMMANENKKIYKNKNIFLPTYPNFFHEVTSNTQSYYIFRPYQLYNLYKMLGKYWILNSILGRLVLAN